MVEVSFNPLFIERILKEKSQESSPGFESNQMVLLLHLVILAIKAISGRNQDSILF